MVQDRCPCEHQSAQGEDAGSEIEHLLSQGSAQQRAKAAAEEQIVDAGEGRRIRKVHIAQVRTCGHQNDTDEENRDAGDRGEADQTLERTNAVEEEGPDEVELLFDLQRPEMIDTDSLQNERATRPKGKIRCVR